MNKRQNPIAVFDSGAGGISVLKELVKLMPNENYIYYGDSLNAPYGTRPTEEVRQLTIGCIDTLVEMGIKEAVIACNTATSAAIRELRVKYPHIPMIGLEPALKPAAINAEGGRVLIMATKLTLREEKLHALMEKYKAKAEIILLPCSELVEFVERGETDSPELHRYLSEILAPYIGNVDGIVMGCTHFPLAGGAIKKAAPGIRLYDGGMGAARQAQRLLKSSDLLTLLTGVEGGNIRFMSSLEGKEELYKKLFYN